MTDTQKTVEAFFSHYPKLTFKKGSIIVRAGDVPSGVMYIIRGHVRMYAISPLGDVVVLHVFKPGSFFPMLWAMGSEENRYYFDAATPIEIYRAPREDVLAFCEHNPKVLFDLTRRLLAGIQGLLTRLESLVFGEASAKTALLLLHYSKLFGEETPEGTVLKVSLTHREIASWIGTTRETASLQIERMQKEGIIRYRGRTIIIVDPEGLKKKTTFS